MSYEELNRYITKYRLIEVSVHSEERVEVDPQRAMRCGWCRGRDLIDAI